MARKSEAKAAPDLQQDLQEDLRSLSFEQLLERLEQVVESLEEGDCPLEDALSAFERGVTLSRLGAQRLDEAERRIEVLLRDNRTRPLKEEPEDDE